MNKEFAIILYLSLLFLSGSLMAEDQAAIKNSLCPYNKEQVEKDSSIYFRKKHSGSALVMNAQQNKNMESYYALCGQRSNEIYTGNYAKLFEENYPNYIKIQQGMQNKKNALLANRPPLPAESKPKVSSSGSQASQSTENQPTLQSKSQKPVIINPACQLSEIKVEEDSKAKLKLEYPNSFTTQNMLHISNMKAYRKVCDNPLPEPLEGSAKKLFDQYYPSYITIEMLLDAEVKSFNELNNTHLEKRPSRSSQGLIDLQKKDLEAILDIYQLENGRYPSTSEGLEALVTRPSGMSHWKGPYLKGPIAQSIFKFSYENINGRPVVTSK